MKLNDLVQHISHTGASETDITAITYDSRKACAGSLFVCLVGAWLDGHTYAESAYQNGCRAFLVEHRVDLPADAVQIVTDDTRAALAVSALVPLLSVLCAYRCSRKAALSLDVPRHGEKGAPLVCRLCAPPLLLCEGRAELRLQNAFTREEARAAAVVGEAVSLPVSHCGLLTVTAENAEIRDLFGLCRFPVSSGAPQLSLIHISEPTRH